MTFLSEYFLFIAKALTAGVFTIFIIVLVIGLIAKSKKNKSYTGDLKVNYLNKRFAKDKNTLESLILEKSEKKKLKKNPIEPKKGRDRLFVIDFNGDIQASEVDSLRRQITAIISTAKEKDEVLLRLESPGGVVHGYGLAATQLSRLKKKGILLVASVDKVAASGGYMMASVADVIISAPFAILGSIGVVAQVPNIHRLLKEKKVDIELHTAGKYKRTLTTMGENTDEGREKFKEELEKIHILFKNHISKYRPSLDVEKIATGETWYGTQAINENLVDKIMTSDDFILDAISMEKDVYEIIIEKKESAISKLTSQFFGKVKSEIENKYFL